MSVFFLPYQHEHLKALSANSYIFSLLMKYFGRSRDLRLPLALTLMPSLEISLGHMAKSFYGFEDINVYTDNILLHTKLSFNHHVQHLV
jgi:hypothetical protein